MLPDGRGLSENIINKLTKLEILTNIFGSSIGCGFDAEKAFDFKRQRPRQAVEFEYRECLNLINLKPQFN